MKKIFWCSLGLLGAFALWTAAVSYVDVQAIGPEGSCVGFAGLNQFIHGLTGVHWWLYTVTDWLGLVPVGVGFGFAALGLAQWIARRKIYKVDFSILALGAFYIIILAAYLFFESYAINYRPVLIGGYLEPSYPSSTTLLTLCVMPTAMLQFHRRIRKSALRRWINGAIGVFTAFVVVGRLLSGVHWLSDIIGGGLLSAGLVTMYYFICNLNRSA